MAVAAERTTRDPLRRLTPDTPDATVAAFGLGGEAPTPSHAA